MTKGLKAKLIFNTTPLSQEKYTRDKVWPDSENHRQVRMIPTIKLIWKMQLNFALKGIIFLTIMDKMKCLSKLLQAYGDETINILWIISFSSSMFASFFSHSSFFNSRACDLPAGSSRFTTCPVHSCLARATQMMCFGCLIPALPLRWCGIFLSIFSGQYPSSPSLLVYQYLKWPPGNAKGKYLILFSRTESLVLSLTFCKDT